MFKVTKLVPENTTPWDALNSVADVSLNPIGIDGISEDSSGPIYWYLYFNGRHVSRGPSIGSWDEIKLQDGETMHWDFQKQIYTEHDSFTPPCTVQSYVAGDDLYPEPFTHGFPMNLGSGDGYSRTVWNTVIVYPAGSSDFQSIADDIKNTLVAGGVPAGQISITDDTSITSDQEQNSNLILIGSYTANSLIESVNPSHEAIGMPVYFDYTSCEIMEDDDDSTTLPKNYTHGAVAEAFDNPWNNGAHVDHAGSVILMASGLNDGDAKDAANMLISETDELDRFWRMRLMLCGDVDCNTFVNVGDALAVYNNVPTPEQLCSNWAPDVDCNKVINVGDALAIYNNVPTPWLLSCCTGCTC